MLSLSPATRVFLATRPIDGQKSFNALSVLVKETLQQEPTSGYLFVFINKARRQPARATPEHPGQSRALSAQ